MFGDLGSMMQKLKESKQKIEETKNRLNTVYVEGTSNHNAVKVSMTGNREVKSIHIDDTLLNNKEALEDFLILAINDAIDKATKLQEAELGAVAKEGLPNIPGLDNFL
ncbi:YbaB/EbfC family nucleoid-associated protein [Flavobacteriaceae bacterium F08102]|nr:YbaB/EbfC family nucleoid-associated protein [Flavobacteriaceae bacterium F08102]